MHHTEIGRSVKGETNQFGQRRQKQTSRKGRPAWFSPIGRGVVPTQIASAATP
jgi:hypothetical protein